MQQELRQRDRKQIVRLLGVLQGLLESAIEAALIPGTGEVATESDRGNVAADRADWLACERIIKRLEVK